MFSGCGGTYRRCVGDIWLFASSGSGAFLTLTQGCYSRWSSLSSCLSNRGITDGLGVGGGGKVGVGIGVAWVSGIGAFRAGPRVRFVLLWFDLKSCLTGVGWPFLWST